MKRRISHGCQQPGRHGEVDARDREQPPDRGIIHRALGDLPIENRKIFTEPVQFAYMPLDGNLLILRHRLAFKPVPPSTVEQIGMRALRNKVGVQDGMDLDLDPRPMPHNLVAARRQPPHALRGGVRRPDLRQIARGIQVGQGACIDLIGLHMREAVGGFRSGRSSTAFDPTEW